MTKAGVKAHLKRVKGRKKTTCRPCLFSVCTGCSKLNDERCYDRKPTSGGRYMLVRKKGTRPYGMHHCLKHCRHKVDIKKLPPVDVKGIGYGV